MYPDNDYEDDLQEELEQLAEDDRMGIRGWDFVDNIGSNEDDDDDEPNWFSQYEMSSTEYNDRFPPQKDDEDWRKDQ